MGDHFALLVDHLLTESTLDAAIEGWKRGAREISKSTSLDQAVDEMSDTKNEEQRQMFSGKTVECRICQEEDQALNMDAPCSCCGSLKYAHRKCIQKWCNEKGDTVCEICLQQFKPGYTAPPKLFHYGSIPMNLRGTWEISRQEGAHDSSMISLLPFDHGLVQPDDQHQFASMRSTVCFRSAAIMFMFLLTLRHILPLVVGAEQYSLALFSLRLHVLLLLRSAGIFVSIFVMVRLLVTFKQRRRGQRRDLRQMSVSSSEGESNSGVSYLRTMSPHLHVVQV